MLFSALAIADCNTFLTSTDILFLENDKEAIALEASRPLIDWATKFNFVDGKLIQELNIYKASNKKFVKFWPAIHVVGKDILRFHAIYWPAFLLAAKIEPPIRVFGHGWILSGDEKMSKSKGNILNPIEIIDNYGIDELRYYLMKEVSHGSDGNISLKSLENCINSDLANNYGNLCQRVFSFIKNNCKLKVIKTKNIITR